MRERQQDEIDAHGRGRIGPDSCLMSGLIPATTYGENVETRLANTQHMAPRRNTSGATSKHETGKSVFERHPKKTLAAVVVVLSLCLIGGAELILRRFAGFGGPVLYDRNPAFGFRLQPNQKVHRYSLAEINVNNLGLRAAGYWDSATEDKILFLGDSVTHGGNWITDDDLFSRIAVEDFPGFQSGNAGVPNWGVENVYGLVVDSGFRPANTYVTTFIEGDFYRGLVRAENKPWIWYEPPRFALREVSCYVWYRYCHAAHKPGPTPEATLRAAVERAARKLKQMDEVLKSRADVVHLILISPTRSQVLGQEGKDSTVRDALTRHGIDAVYMLDKLETLPVSREVKEEWFQDAHHLTKNGHRIWGELIAGMLRHHITPSAGQQSKRLPQSREGT